MPGEAYGPDGEVDESFWGQQDESCVTGALTEEEIYAKVNALPGDWPELIHWTIEGYKPREIAEMKGKEVGAIKMALSRARAELRKTLYD